MIPTKKERELYRRYKQAVPKTTFHDTLKF
jgi:hypothetical protein